MILLTAVLVAIFAFVVWKLDNKIKQLQKTVEYLFKIHNEDK